MQEAPRSRRPEHPPRPLGTPPRIFATAVGASWRVFAPEHLHLGVAQIAAFAERASAAGVKARLSLHDDTIHAWQIHPFLPNAQPAIDEIARFAHEGAAPDPSH